MSNLNIEQQLRETWQQGRKLCHIRGFFRSAIWLAMLVFLGLVIDYTILYKTRMPVGLTIFLGVAGLGTMVWIVWREWISQLQPFNAKKIAFEVEEKNPELMSSLISYTEFKEASEASTASPELLEAMRNFAIQKSSQIKFADVIDFAQLKKLFKYAAIVLIVSAALSVQWSEHFSALFKRMAGIETTYPAQTQMLAITGHIIIPSGRTAEIDISASGVIPDVAVLYVKPTDGSGDWVELPLTKLENGFSFRRKMDAPEREMDYYITMGDYRSEDFTISVIKAPRLVKTAVHFEFPAYLNRDKETSDQLNIEVPEGTTITWKLASDKKISNLKVKYGDKSIDAKVGGNGKDISFKMTADKSFAYTFYWTEGGSGQDFHFEDVEYNVKVTRDSLPQVSFVGRAPNGPATINKTVAFNWKAKDDYGLNKLRLVYTVIDPETQQKVVSQSLLVADLQDQLSDSGKYEWQIAKYIKDLKPGYQVNYHLELSDFKEDARKRVSLSSLQQLNITANEDYMAWFRRALKARNEIVKTTFVAERTASKQLKIIILDNNAEKNAAQVKQLEVTQGAEARKMAKVAGDISWLIQELQSNKLMKEGGGKKLQTYQQVLKMVSNESLPLVTGHLRNARLEPKEASHYLTSAKEEVDAVVEELKKVLASSSTLLLEEALITELKDMIKVQNEIRGKTAEWGKALLISPDTAEAGKGPLVQTQADMLNRYESFLKQLEKAKKDALDDLSKERFEQAAHVLNPTPPKSANKIVQSVLNPEPTTADFIKAVDEQLESSDVISAVGTQDRIIASFKGALQILSAGKFDLGDFVAGLEKLIEKQKVLRKEVEAETNLSKKSAFYEARQIEIQNDVTDYSFNAPDLFISKEGEFIVEPLMVELEDAVESLKDANKEKTLGHQAKIIVLLKSVYGTALEQKEMKEGDPFFAPSPVVPEELWKLPKDTDTEDEDLAEKDDEFPEIFEGIEAAELSIQSDSAAQGAQEDVTTAMAASRDLNFDESAPEDPPSFVTDTSPPSVGTDENPTNDVPPGGKGEDSNTAKVEAERLAKESMERRRQKAKIQDYVRKLPPEFRKQVADYYEVIAK